MKPEYKVGMICPDCNDNDAVALQDEHSALVWCACGKVTAFPGGHEIHDFIVPKVVPAH